MYLFLPAAPCLLPNGANALLSVKMADNQFVRTAYFIPVDCTLSTNSKLHTELWSQKRLKDFLLRHSQEHIFTLDRLLMERLNKIEAFTAVKTNSHNLTTGYSLLSMVTGRPLNWYLNISHKSITTARRHRGSRAFKGENDKYLKLFLWWGRGQQHVVG